MNSRLVNENAAETAVFELGVAVIMILVVIARPNEDPIAGIRRIDGGLNRTELPVMAAIVANRQHPHTRSIGARSIGRSTEWNRTCRHQC